jgi:AcrR family transcriptional regulator
MAVTPQRDGRRRRSDQTRARIVRAARERFVELGFVATTIESIAVHAEVATQTVYYLFGTKRNVLAAVLDTSIVGDDHPTPVAGRSWLEELREERDPPAAIERLATECTAILRRVAPVYDVVRGAAADPEVAELLDQNRAGRRADQRMLVEILVTNGHLRADLDLDTAADAVYGLISEDVYLLLTRDCGWDDARFQHWITDLLAQQLLP